MKILLIEYITAGGLSHVPLPSSLLLEGTLMRDALLRDFSGIDDIEIVATYDARLAVPKHIKQAISIDDSSNATATWQSLLQTCDAALLVAPETNGVLTNLTQMVEAAGVENLGCTQLAVNVASSKYDTYHLLDNANILTIPTYIEGEFSGHDFTSDKSFNNGCVAKPDDGAGCENTLYFKDLTALQAWLHLSIGSDKQLTHIIQPYQTGIPASISILCKHGKAWVLSCNQQTIEIHTTQANEAAIQYKGCLVNGLSIYHDAFAKLANSIAAALPGLHGYVGIDVIINNEDIYVVEINPRITTSYIGLCESLNCNPAKLILDLAYNQTFILPENMATNMVEISVTE